MIMTDEDIIKALECLVNGGVTIAKEALDLINRKDEIINGLIAGQETLQKHLAEKMQKLID